MPPTLKWSQYVTLRDKCVSPWHHMVRFVNSSRLFPPPVTVVRVIYGRFAGLSSSLIRSLALRLAARLNNDNAYT